MRSRESWTNRFRDMPIFHLPCLTIGDIPASCTSTTTPLLKDAQCVDVGYNFAQGMGPPGKLTARIVESPAFQPRKLILASRPDSCIDKNSHLDLSSNSFSISILGYTQVSTVVSSLHHFSSLLYAATTIGR